MTIQQIVQWNYIIYFHILGFFLNNIQGLFVLTIICVDMTIYPLIKYYCIIERVYFIYKVVYIIYHYIVILAVFIYSIMEV